jgi:methionyl-tRNA formyltransferase
VNIIFFGSTDFSLPIVRRIKDKFPLVAIIAVKPKPKGRGLKAKLSNVAEWAQSVGINVLSPENPNDGAFIEEIRALKPDIFVLSAYGYILSGELLSVPKLGGINIHPSLLPKYRGAAPIRRAIMAGEEKTGITVFYMDEKIDHGDMIFQKELKIEVDETYDSLYSRLSDLGAEIIIEVLESIKAGKLNRISQNHKESSYAHKIKKEEMIIDWRADTKKIFNLIRALSPKPGARTTFRNNPLIIIKALAEEKKINPGTIHVENKILYVGTGDGSIILKEVKPAGKSTITSLDFINGFHIKEGERIG